MHGFWHIRLFKYLTVIAWLFSSTVNHWTWELFSGDNFFVMWGQLHKYLLRGCSPVQ